MKIVKAIIVGAMLVFGTANASVSTKTVTMKDNFSPTQMDNLHFAYQYGEQFDKLGVVKESHPSVRYNGKGLGNIMAAIAWQESSAGINLAPKKYHHAYGLFQNYIKTVKAKKAKKGIKMSDRQIINHIMNREVSADYAIDELAYWLKVRKGNIRLALASYNAGWNYKAGLKYADQVLRKANHLKKKKFFELKDC